MYIESLTIDRFQPFEHAETTLLHPRGLGSRSARHPNVNLILGNNGAGKSAALRAAAVALLGPIVSASTHRPHCFARMAPDSEKAPTTVAAQLSLPSPEHDGLLAAGTPTAAERKVRVHRRDGIEACDFDHGPPDAVGRHIREDESAAFFVGGYGAPRLVADAETARVKAHRRLRHLRYWRVASLFEHDATLVPLGTWLAALQAGKSGWYDEAAALIDAMLPEGAGFTGRMREGDYTVRHRGVDTPAAALPDALRGHLAWIGDLLHHLCRCCPAGKRITELEGVAMVDEVGLHLHPQWQQQVLPAIARALPRIQFLCTTQSPLIAGSMESANLLLAAPDPENPAASVLVRPEQEIHSLTANQILGGAYFGLASTRAPAFQKQLRAAARNVSAGKPGAATLLGEMDALGSAAQQAGRK